jgi:hypothetical protein
VTTATLPFRSIVFLSEPGGERQDRSARDGRAGRSELVGVMAANPTAPTPAINRFPVDVSGH